MGIPLVDLQKQYKAIKNEIDDAIFSVLDSGQFILGKYVQQLEKQISEYSTAKYAIGVASGTDALLLALKALDIGVEDEVIVPPFTFFATAGAVHNCGARPIFCEIEPETYTLDPESFKRCITDKTKAVIPVHLFGQCAQMDDILKIARENNIAVIEDAAQSIGALYKNKKSGSIGDLGCFSFFPTKNLGGYGDGGMIVTNHQVFAEKIKLLRVHGGGTQYYHDYVGINSRLDAFQAAIISAKLPFLQEWHEKRRVNAAYYNCLFENTEVRIPVERSDNYSIYNQYTIRIKNRDQVMNALKEKGIGCAIYYPLPLHLQKCFQYLGHKNGDFPVSEKAAAEVLSLPIFPELTREQQEQIAKVVTENM